MRTRDIIGLIGLALLAHDGKDIGKINRLHHWQVGAALLIKPEWFEELLYGAELRL